MENTPVRQVRSARTSQEQLETYITFLEDNPQFLAGKNTPENNNYLQEKWMELTATLNILKGPQKTAKDWKQSLTHWRNQIKSRARKIKEDIILTGGGERSTSTMSSFEQRALHVFGLITVQGDNMVPTMGYPDTTNNMVSSAEVITPIQVICLEPSGAGTSGAGTSYSTNAEHTTSRKRPYNSSFSTAISECVKHISKLATEHAEHDMKMDEKRLAIEQQNANSLSKMAEALYLMAQKQTK